MGIAGNRPPRLDALLHERPLAVVAAVGEDGLFVTAPASLPFGGRTVVEASAATEIVEPAGRRAVIEAWERAIAVGASSAEVKLPGLDDLATLHFLDERDAHGVLVMVLDAGDDPPPVGRAPHETTIAPATVVRVRKDVVAVVQDVSPTVTDILGWRPEDLVDRRSLELIHPDDHELAITAWMDMLAAPGLTTRARLRHARAGGGWTWLDVSNTNMLGEEPARVDCEMVDVSQEVAAVEALHASEQLLRRLTDSMPVGVFHIDAERQLRMANPRLHEMLGTAPGADPATMLSRAVEVLALDRAIEAVLAGRDVDMELEVRPLGSSDVRRCALAMRSLMSDGRITGAVGCLTDVTESVRLREELEHRASVDELTGCLNRSSVLELLERILAADTDVAVVYADIDHFKSVNDDLGHAAGDEVLQAIGARIRAAVREHDAVGRMGGDEFLAVCAGLGSERAADELVERIATAVGDPVAFRRQQVAVGASFGVAWVSAGDGIDADALVARADAAMYGAKRGGRGPGR